MSQVRTVVVDFASEAAQECSGLKLEVPQDEISVGDILEIRLWGGTCDMLNPYSLAQGSDSLGMGKLISTDETDVELVINFAETFSAQFDWPIQSLNQVQVISEIFALDVGGNPYTWASKGQNVTERFRRDGYSCLKEVDATPLFGAVKAYAARTQWYKRWFWTVPNDEGLRWFFLYENAVLRNKFSLTLPELAEAVAKYKNITLMVKDHDTDVLLPGAIVEIDGLVAGTTDENGELKVDGIRTGEHQIKIIKAGYLNTDVDELNNDFFVVY